VGKEASLVLVREVDFLGDELFGWIERNDPRLVILQEELVKRWVASDKDPATLEGMKQVLIADLRRGYDEHIVQVPDASVAQVVKWGREEREQQVKQLGMGIGNLPLNQLLALGVNLVEYHQAKSILKSHMSNPDLDTPRELVEQLSRRSEWLKRTGRVVVSLERQRLTQLGLGTQDLIGLEQLQQKASKDVVTSAMMVRALIVKWEVKDTHHNSNWLMIDDRELDAFVLKNGQFTTNELVSWLESQDTQLVRDTEGLGEFLGELSQQTWQKVTGFSRSVGIDTENLEPEKYWQEKMKTLGGILPIETLHQGRYGLNASEVRRAELLGLPHVFQETMQIEDVVLPSQQSIARFKNLIGRYGGALGKSDVSKLDTALTAINDYLSAVRTVQLSTVGAEAQKSSATEALADLQQQEAMQAENELEGYEEYSLHEIGSQIGVATRLANRQVPAIARDRKIRQMIEEWKSTGEIGHTWANLASELAYEQAQKKHQSRLNLYASQLNEMGRKRKHNPSFWKRIEMNSSKGKQASNYEVMATLNRFREEMMHASGTKVLPDELMSTHEARKTTLAWIQEWHEAATYQHQRRLKGDSNFFRLNIAKDDMDEVQYLRLLESLHAYVHSVVTGETKRRKQPSYTLLRNFVVLRLNQEWEFINKYEKTRDRYEHQARTTFGTSETPLQEVNLNELEWKKYLKFLDVQILEPELDAELQNFTLWSEERKIELGEALAQLRNIARDSLKRSIPDEVWALRVPSEEQWKKVFGAQYGTGTQRLIYQRTMRLFLSAKNNPYIDWTKAEGMGFDELRKALKKRIQVIDVMTAQGFTEAPVDELEKVRAVLLTRRDRALAEQKISQANESIASAALKQKEVERRLLETMKGLGMVMRRDEWERVMGK
jgi:hypothetical protein